MSQPTPLVSVVTPFHNSAPYLTQCVESVLAQTLGDFEYILVDNQSTDGSGEIAARFARQDPRVRVVTTDRLLPQVPNYNFALSRISPASRWCKLVQADDWIAPESLARSVAVGESSNRVGLVGCFSLEGLEVTGLGLPYETPVIPGREACRLQLLEGRFLFGSPTSVLYRAAIVRSRTPFYEEHRLHEDTEIAYQVLRDWDFGFVHQVLAYLRVGNGVSGRAATFNPHLLDKYIVLKRFGRDFLSAAEYDRTLRNVRSLYDRFIGESALRRREPTMWEYHRAGLASIGERLSPGRIARSVARALAHHLTHPAEGLQWLRRRLA